MKKDYKETLKKLKNELNENKNEDFILKMFEDRIRDIDSAIARHKDYKKNVRKIDKVFDDILEKNKDSYQISLTFENYSDAVYCSVYAYEKLLYKYGVMDGMRLVIDGLKDVDIENM